MSLVASYTKEVWQGLGYHATWLPNSAVGLGDVGTITKGRFEPVTTLGSLGVDLGPAVSAAKLDLHYVSKGGSDVQFKPLVEASGVGAVSVQVRMKREGAVVFAAKSCVTARVPDREWLRRRLVELQAIGGWQTHWVVVTELVTTGSATILVSSSASAEVELSGSPALDSVLGLADVDVGLKLQRSSGMAAQILAAQELTPLFSLSGLRRKWLGGAELTTRSGESSDAEAPWTLPELSPDELCTP